MWWLPRSGIWGIWFGGLRGSQWGGYHRVGVGVYGVGWVILYALLVLLVAVLVTTITSLHDLTI